MTSYITIAIIAVVVITAPRVLDSFKTPSAMPKAPNQKNIEQTNSQRKASALLRIGEIYGMLAGKNALGYNAPHYKTIMFRNGEKVTIDLRDYEDNPEFETALVKGTNIAYRIYDKQVPHNKDMRMRGTTNGDWTILNHPIAHIEKIVH